MNLAITGVGVMSKFGTSFDNFANNICSDPQATSSETTRLFDDFDPTQWLGQKGHRNCDRLTKMMIAAARTGLEHAYIKSDGRYLRYHPETFGICSATAYGSLDAITELNRVAELEAPRYINPSRFPNTVINAAAGYVSIWEDMRAPNVTLVNGNCGALDTAFTAQIHIQSRRGEAFLIGGGEVFTEPLRLALEKLGFSRESFRIGEGVAYLVAENADLEDARERALAYVVGYGSAFHPPASEAALLGAHPQAVVGAALGAMEQAGVHPNELSLVVRDACGIPEFDDVEDKAIAQLELESTPSITPKATLGETFGASGAFALVSALATKHTGRLNGQPAPELNNVLIWSIGHYGNVSAIVLRFPQ